MQEDQISFGYSQRTAGANGIITSANCVGAPSVVATAANTFAVGAIMYQRDVSTNYSTLVWKNTGTVAAPVWTLQQSSGIITKKVSLTSAEILALNTTPKVLVQAAGAGTVIIPVFMMGKTTFATAAYATNLALRAKYVAGADELFTNSTLLAVTATARQPFYPVAAGSVTANDNEYVENANLVLDVASGNPATGAGTLEVVIGYMISPVLA